MEFLNYLMTLEGDNGWSPNFSALGLGGLQVVKVIPDLGLVVIEALGSGVFLVTLANGLSPFLATGSAKNLDSAFTDLADGVGNIYFGFKGDEPSNLVDHGPIGSIAEDTFGDTEFLDKAATSADLFVFSPLDTPKFASQASGAYKIYKNASSAGVGSSSLAFLIDKSSEYLYNALDLVSEIVSGDDILSNVENSTINN